MNDIPKGYKLVPVEPTDDMIVAFAEAWYSKRQTIDDPEMMDAYRDMLAAAPAPPQPIYDEAKEQYVPVMQWSDDGVNWMDGQPNEIESARSYGWQTRTLYSKAPDIPPDPAAKCASCDGSGSVCIDWDSGSWSDCPECAQSRAKAGEDE